MKKLLLCLILLAQAAQAGCPRRQPPPPASPAARTAKARQAAVAGLFYPQRKESLEQEIDKHLGQAADLKLADLRAVICPHAGYEFSGPVAAHAYRQLQGRAYKTVIALAGSHYALFSGGCLGDYTSLATPLGEVPVSPLSDELDGRGPFARHLVSRVDRPGWWRQSPAEVPPFGQDTPMTWEHSLEVQLPFLQRVLTGFQVVPVVFGEVDPAQAAEALDAFLDEQTLVVASTDLSHFLSYDEAKSRDAATVKAICDLKADEVGDHDACGHAAVRTLICLARKNHWTARLLDCRNSGDTAKSPERIVGYAAIAFTGPPGVRKTPPPRNYSTPAAATQPAQFSPADRKAMLALARCAVEAAARGTSLPDPGQASLPSPCRYSKGCFVTLNKRGELRGCIGNIMPQRPLGQAIVDNACSAATRDHRFPPVTPEELAELDIEISVLTVPQPLEFASPEDLLAKLRPHADGVILQVGNFQATFLPQVWEKIPQREAFLNQLAYKAGLQPSGWRMSEAKVMTYQVEAFSEKDAGK